ncbi:3590_t:CDS:2, partial [Racocetra fulgida]
MSYQHMLSNLSKVEVKASEKSLTKSLESKLCDLNDAMEKIIHIPTIVSNIINFLSFKMIRFNSGDIWVESECDDIVDQIERLYCFGGGGRTVSVNKLTILVEDQDIMTNLEEKEFIEIKEILENLDQEYGELRGFGTISKSIWIDGFIKQWDIENEIWIRDPDTHVVLK